MKPTIVLGATTNPYRYSYLAVNKLIDHNYKVYPVGIRKGSIIGNKIINDLPNLKDIHTITIYLSPQKQIQYYDYILSLNPKRVIFNPGTYNPELVKILKEKNIETTTACTLIMLDNEMY